MRKWLLGPESMPEIFFKQDLIVMYMNLERIDLHNLQSTSENGEILILFVCYIFCCFYGLITKENAYLFVCILLPEWKQISFILGLCLRVLENIPEIVFGANSRCEN